MRYLFAVFSLFLVACTSSGDSETGRVDSVSRGDTLPDYTKVPGSVRVNAMLDSLGIRARVTTDSLSGWTTDALEYFVYPQRKVDPDYPYIAKGDFDCDGIPDWAVLVSDTASMTRLLLVSGKTPRNAVWWEEDMRGAALSRFPRQEFGAMKDEEELWVKLPCDAIEAEWFEKATQVIYRDQNRWQRVWTAD